MRRPSPPAFLLALVVGAGAFWLAAAPQHVRAGDEQQPHLDYRRTYAEALLEGRIRNVPLLVTRHKDD